MNRNVLNSVPIGIGVQNSFISVAISQVVKVVGALRAYVIHYSNITVSHTQVSAIGAGSWVSGKILTVAELTGSATGSVLHRVYGACTHAKQLLGTVILNQLRYVKLGGAPSLSNSITPTVWRTVRQSVSTHASLLSTLTASSYVAVSTPVVQAHQLATQVVAHDLNFEPAPQTRRVALVVSKRRVAVSAKPL